MEKNLLDNDIVKKISQYSLVDEFYQIAGSPDSIFILPSLKYVFKLNDKTKALSIIKSEDALLCLKKFVSNVHEITTEAPEELLTTFSEIDGIESGEAILFALTATDNQSMTYTGDKRALRALATLGCETGLTKQLRGQLKCLEQVVASTIINCNESDVINKIHGEEWDKTLNLCFSSTEPKQILEGLKSYYNEVNNACGKLLAEFPSFPT